MIKRLLTLLVSILIIGLTACAEATTHFEILLTDAGFVCDESNLLDINSASTQKSYLRLQLSFEINNISNVPLEGVWYEFQLNEEARAYIASQMLGLKSDPMDLVTKEQFLSASKDAHFAWGFVSNWSPLITSPEILEEYHSLKLTDIDGAIQYVDVTVHWNGGSQTERLAIDFSPEDLSLIQSLEGQYVN